MAKGKTQQINSIAKETVCGHRGKDWDELSFPDEKQSWTLMDSEFHQIEARILVLWKRKVENIFAIGEQLIAYKKLTDKNFKQNITERFPFSYSTAISYKNVAERFESAEVAGLFDSKALYALASSKFPSELREEIIEKAQNGEQFPVESVRFAKDWYQSEKCQKDNESKEDFIDTNGPLMVPAEIAGVMRVEDVLTEALSLAQSVAWPDEPGKWLLHRMDMVQALIRKINAAFWPSPEKSDSRTSE